MRRKGGIDLRGDESRVFRCGVHGRAQRAGAPTTATATEISNLKFEIGETATAKADSKIPCAITAHGAPANANADPSPLKGIRDYSHVSGLDRVELVEPMGFEPTTSSMPSRRAPNCATAPPFEELRYFYITLLRGGSNFLVFL